MRAADRAETIRQLAIASIVAQATWLVLVVVAGLIEPGYSEVRDAVSVLGARDAARPWLFDTGVAIWGCSFLFAAAALALDSRRSWRNWLGPGLIALTGVAQILDGFPFPADCRWSVDATCRAREMAGELSWQHYATASPTSSARSRCSLRSSRWPGAFAPTRAGDTRTCSRSPPACWGSPSSAFSSS
jgi:hypothetical protein